MKGLALVTVSYTHLDVYKRQAYNTGNMVKGFRNGYVAKYYKGGNIAKLSKTQQAAI